MPLPLGLILLPLASQEAAAPFDAPVFVVQDVNAPILQRLFDFDGDGFLDAVGTKSNRHAVWHNDGQGGLAVVLDQTLGAVSDPPEHVEVGDFDGDGLDDFALGEGWL